MRRLGRLTLMSTTIIYHGPGCADGFCAAWIAHRRLGDDAAYLPAQYGDAPPDISGQDVLILDFSYPREVLLTLAARNNRVVVLDHHKTAQQDLADLGGEKLLVRFDMGKSGGRLTWEHFYPDEPAPWLVEYTEARDLWTFHLPFSREISAAIGSYPMDFTIWNALEEALSNDPTDLRNLRGGIPETAADFTRRKAKEVLLPGVSLQKDAR
jgi:hypothetical protein